MHALEAEGKILNIGDPVAPHADIAVSIVGFDAVIGGVADVISELERQFDLEISFPEELKNQKYNLYHKMCPKISHAQIYFNIEICINQ